MASSVLERFRAIRWAYANRDDAALRELRHRIAETGRHRGLVEYSDLVQGVTFTLPSIAQGAPFQIETSDWADLDRALLGDFLGYLSLETFERHGFLASALVVSKTDDTPSEGFWSLLKALGMITSSKTDKATYCWLDQVRLAHDWYSSHPDRDL
jgi:hypothetical protein